MTDASTFDRAAFERYLAERLAATDTGRVWDAKGFVTTLLERATDEAYLRSYAEACPVAGATPQDYSARVLQLDPSCSVVAAIHFRGRSTDFPFVDVSAQSGPLPRPVPIDKLTAPFRLFRPRAVRVWRSGTEAALEGAEDDQVVVGGSLAALRALPRLPEIQRIRLEPDPALDCYDQYLGMYEPAHTGIVSPGARYAEPETRSSLGSCVAAGAFFRVVIDDTFAGVIAARPDSYRGWRGWYMVEEVLRPDFRGRHLAPPMQQALLRRLDPGKEPFVFGTIAAGNIASLRTAQRVGRHVLEIGAFVKLELPV